MFSKLGTTKQPRANAVSVLFQGSPKMWTILPISPVGGQLLSLSQAGMKTWTKVHEDKDMAYWR